jgi:hypothetical protein
MVEELRETVRVTARGDTVDLDKTESATKFSDDFIADLPVLDRFYQNVLTMAPGVQDADGDGNPNVHGSRKRDFQATVGGVSNVDPLTGQWLSRVNPNSIEEMEVITAGAGVEFGRAQGGFARIIQKQGSNRHEGVVEFHYQTSQLDGDGASDNSALPSPEFTTVQPGFQFSGPVIKDKLWYRVSYERREREDPINIISDIGLFTETLETRDAQLTWQVSPRNKLTFNVRADPVEQSNFGISNAIPLESSQSRERDVDTWSVTWTAPVSPRVLVETTTAWQDVSLFSGPAFLGVPNDCVPNSVTGILRDALCTNLTSGPGNDPRFHRTSGSYNETTGDNRQRFTVKSQATLFAGRLWGGDHQVKMGLSIENERYFRDLTRGPSITFQEVHPFGGQAFAIVLADVAVPFKDRVQATGTNWGIYAEDQYKPAGNVTITLGARVDREELNSQGREQMDPSAELAAWEDSLEIDDGFFLPSGDWGQFFTGYESFLTYRTQLVDVLCAGLDPSLTEHCRLITSPSVISQQQEGLEAKRRSNGVNIRNTNVSPFLAVAWDPWSNGKTALKVAAGRHYNNTPLVVPLQELEPVRTTVEYRADLATFQTKIFGNISPNINARTVDYGLSTPYQDEFMVSFEREIATETSISLSYVNRQFRDQFQDHDINITTADYGTCATLQQQIERRVSAVLPPDGVEDDCGGITAFFGGTNTQPPFRIQFPDGKPDLYIQNPFWGSILEIGNLNEIDYEAVVFELVRRQYRSWEMNASYTYSRAEGNGEDFLQELGDDPALRAEVDGFQSYDQRHVVKVNATTITPWGLRLGTAVTWQSGLPYTILAENVSDDILPPSTSHFVPQIGRIRQSYPTGKRNDQRNIPYWNVDVKITKELRLGRQTNLQLSAEVFNLLADDTYIIYNPFFERGQQLNGRNEATRRFGRRWQVGAKFAF